MTKHGTIRFYESVDWQRLERVTTPAVKDYIFNVHRYLLEHVRGNVLVLEVGCGSGDFIKKISRQVDSIIGLDVSPTLIALAQKNLEGVENIRLIAGDIDSTQIPRNHFDVIISMWTLPNIDEPLAFICKMKDALKDSGTIFIDTYSERATAERLDMYRAYGLTVCEVLSDEILLQEGLTEKIYTKQKLEHLFERAGLDVEIIEIHPLGYLCCATKPI